MDKQSLQNRNGVVKTLAEWEAMGGVQPSVEFTSPTELPVEPETNDGLEDVKPEKQKRKKK